jgi:hypothetical protein
LFLYFESCRSVGWLLWERIHFSAATFLFLHATLFH